MADEGLHFKDWAAPIAAVLGVIFGWVGSLLGSVNRMQTTLAAVEAKQADVISRLNAIDAKIESLDRYGTRALDAIKVRIDNLACQKGNCDALAQHRRREEDEEGQEP